MVQVEIVVYEENKIHTPANITDKIIFSFETLKEAFKLIELYEGNIVAEPNSIDFVIRITEVV